MAVFFSNQTFAKLQTYSAKSINIFYSMDVKLFLFKILKIFFLISKLGIKKKSTKMGV